MIVCSLASARVRDGSLFSVRWNPAQLEDPPSETFYEAAKDAIRRNLSTKADYNCMRVCALLAITNIQSGQIRQMHQNLARYHSIVAMEGLHDEANWPKDKGIVETEGRRRLVSLNLRSRPEFLIQSPVLVHLHPGRLRLRLWSGILCL